MKTVEEVPMLGVEEEIQKEVANAIFALGEDIQYFKKITCILGAGFCGVFKMFRWG